MDGFAFDDESQHPDMDTALNGDRVDGVDRGARVVYEDAGQAEARARLMSIFGGGDAVPGSGAGAGTGKAKEKEKEKSPTSSTETPNAQPQIQPKPKPKPKYTAKALQLDDDDEEEVEIVDPPLPPLKGGRKSSAGSGSKRYKAQNGTRSGSRTRKGIEHSRMGGF
jgi:hypothetical protein